MENKEYEKKIALVFDQINQNQSQKKSKKYDARYQYWPGKAFRMIPVTDYREYLNTALEAEAFIHQFQVEDTDGIYWAGYLGGDAISLSYGCGAAGIAYFYLELYKATGDERFKETVLKAGAYLCKHWRDPLNAPKTGRKIHSEYSYTSGVVGIAMSLFLFYETFHREEEKTALTEMADLIVANASEDQRGVFWDDDPTMAFDAGTTLFLFKAAEVLNRKDYLDTARKAADVILSSGVADERGGTAWDTKMDLFPCRLPNFEMGTAGTGFCLSVFYEHTQEEKFLQGAKEAAKHLKAISVPKGKGFLIPYRDEPDTEPIFYVAGCHGPTGTGKLFYQLYKITKDQAYLRDLTGLYEGLRAIGAPEIQSAGYWNTACVCCGTAGILQFLLDLYLVDPNEALLDVSKTAASILLAEQEKQAQGTAWPHAWTRVTPDFITVDPGFVNGAAGIGSMLLRMYLLSAGRFHCDRFLEDPYPTTINE